MAELTLKVSETKYKDTVNKLAADAGKLGADLLILKGIRQKLSSDFISQALSGQMIDMIQRKEKEVQGSIDSILKQITQIELFLGQMSKAETTVGGKIKEAADTGADVFR